ncbi:MBL fold metallo-hydrolase [Peribacillus sp. SCS-37]|uniref:MBL fold metallo-hydrolase n=1 Tax=Paraperibacillus esterisolvens TaxID=3115296 RepID=UPI0039069F5B
MVRKSEHFTIERIKDGIYAAIAKSGGGAVSNAGIIDLGDKTIIFDTFNSHCAAKELAEAAAELTKVPVQYVINSHWHGDHIRGNQCFKKAVIISSIATRTKMLETHPERISDQKSKIPQLLSHIEKLEGDLKGENNAEKAKKLKIQLDFLKEIERSLPGLEFTPPAITFDKRVIFSGTEKKAVLETLGGGHSICDSFLYIPEDRILFTGDLVTVGRHPMLRDGNPESWHGILEKLAKYKVDALIPGHGPAADEQAIADLMNYLVTIKELAARLTGDEAPFERASIPADYKDWQGEDTFRSNLEFLLGFKEPRPAI